MAEFGLKSERLGQLSPKRSFSGYQCGANDGSEFCILQSVGDPTYRHRRKYHDLCIAIWEPTAPVATA
jgi:hypothetical protein